MLGRFLLARRRAVIAAILASLGLGAACGDGGGGADAGPDARPDAGPDDGGADAAPDGSTPACEFPAPRMGDSTEARALAQAPARCGQAPHRWLDSPELGDVVDVISKAPIRAAFLEEALRSQGYEPPDGLEHDAALRQIVYVTQDRGELAEASALVAYPHGGVPEPGPHEVLLLLHGTAGFNDECAPSNDLVGQALPALFASLGYVVVAPDYLGLKGAGDPSPSIHPYLVGQATAIASLDSVRALSKLSPADRGGGCVAPRVVIFGGSQGGHAALWVDRLLPYYAAELEAVGTVATVPPSDMVGHMERALGELVPATGNTAAFYGTASFWYGVGDRLDEIFLEPYDTAVPETLASSCGLGGAAPDVMTVQDAFQPALLDAVADGGFADLDPWGCMAVDNGLTTTSVDRMGSAYADSYGLLLIYGESDELVHTPVEREAVPVLCDQGMPIRYLECAGADHLEASLWSIAETLEFIRARQAGEPPSPEELCTVGEPVVCSGTP